MAVSRRIDDRVIARLVPDHRCEVLREGRDRNIDICDRKWIHTRTGPDTRTSVITSAISASPFGHWAKAPIVSNNMLGIAFDAPRSKMGDPRPQHQFC